MIHKIREGETLPNGVWFKFGLYHKTYITKYNYTYGKDDLVETVLQYPSPTSTDGWWFTLGIKIKSFIASYRYRSWTHNTYHWGTQNAIHEEWKKRL